MERWHCPSRPVFRQLKNLTRVLGFVFNFIGYTCASTRAHEHGQGHPHTLIHTFTYTACNSIVGFTCCFACLTAASCAARVGYNYLALSCQCSYFLTHPPLLCISHTHTFSSLFLYFSVSVVSLRWLCLSLCFCAGSSFALVSQL